MAEHMRTGLDKLNVTPSVRKSLRLVTMAGCMFMVFNTGIMCPAFTQFFSKLGAHEGHFGLLGGIPMVMLFMQFVGAALTNRTRSRKAIFMPSLIIGRLLFIPIVFGPLLVPEHMRPAAIWAAIALYAAKAALINMGGPSWFSWMADIIPKRVLNAYFGYRHRLMFVTWTCAYLIVAVLSRTTSLPITTFYPTLVTFAVVVGVTDILLFFWVHEPPNTITRGRSALSVLMEPLLHSEFRTFVIFACARSAAIMFAAAFMQLYVLQVLGLTVWQSTLIWCVYGVGNALAASRFGRVADKHGHRSILALCVSLKSVVTFAFLLIDKRSALWVLPLIFLLDSVLNAGLVVASNGYVMKIAPKENRSMFSAAIGGFAGVCGGLSAMLAGTILRATPEFSVFLFGREWINYHLIFLCSALMRIGCVFLATRIREPRSTDSREVLFQLVGIWPMRFMKFPVGLYRHGVSLVNRRDKTE